MRHLFQQYLSSIVVLSFGLIGMMIAFVYLMQPQIANSTNIDENLLEHGVYEEVNQKNTYTFEVENEVTANFLDYNPRDEKYFTAKYYDGSDLKDFVLIKGAPGFRDKEGDYNVSYYLKFEGSTDVKTMLVHFTRIGNPYIETIRNVQKLYDVGESNLTEEDIVKIGDIDCYVLYIDEENNKAKMITKDLYKVPFDSSGEEVYKYSESTLKTFMDSFYDEYLDNEKFVLDTNIKSYWSSEFAYFTKGEGYSLVNYDELNQKVFPLDVYEAQEHDTLFDVNSDNNYGIGFWLNAAVIKNNQAAALIIRNYESRTGNTPPYMHYSNIRRSDTFARPVFYISLEEDVEIQS